MHNPAGYLASQIIKLQEKFHSNNYKEVNEEYICFTTFLNNSMHISHSDSAICGYQCGYGKTWVELSKYGGEGGIRTLGTQQRVQRFSRPPRSTTLAPLHGAIMIRDF